MPDRTYILRFTLRDGTSKNPCEEQEHATLPSAWEAFRLFAEPDSSEIYTHIALTEYDWLEGAMRHIASMDFGEQPA